MKKIPDGSELGRMEFLKSNVKVCRAFRRNLWDDKYLWAFVVVDKKYTHD